MISTHILDTTRGRPAEGVAVLLESQAQGSWKKIQEARTNADGRIVFDCPFVAGVYRLTFETEAYFQGQEHFFLSTPVVFRIQDTQRKYHVPLLLNPYGYSTYRGS